MYVWIPDPGCKDELGFFRLVLVQALMAHTPCRECSGKFGAGPLCEVCGALYRIRSYLLSPRCPGALWEIVSERLTDLHRRVLEEAEEYWAKTSAAEAPDTSRHTQAGLAPLASGARSAGVPGPEESKQPESPGASGGLKAKAKTSEPEEESESSEEPSAPEYEEGADYERPRSPTPVPPRKTSRSRGRSHDRRKKSSRRTPSPPPEPPRHWTGHQRDRKRRRENSPHPDDTGERVREVQRAKRERDRARPRSPTRSPVARDSGRRRTEPQRSGRSRGGRSPHHQKKKKNKGKAKRERNRQFWKGSGKGKQKGRN